MRIDFGGFMQHLDTLPLGEASKKTFKSGFRRITRDLDDADVGSPLIVRQYRDSLKTGTRNVVDNVWKHFREYAGDGIARPDKLPYVKYPHPLFADMTFLIGHFGADALPTKTWADIAGHFEEDAIRRHALRCHRFIAPDREPSPHDPLVPKDADGNPMQPWLIRWIVNSEAVAGTYPTCALMKEFVSRLSTTDLSASFLRRASNRIVGTRRASTPHQIANAQRQIRAAFDAGKLEVVEWLVEQMPQSVGDDDAPEIMW